MLRFEYFPKFTLKILKSDPIEQMIEKLAKHDYCHIRLQHFPLEIAIVLWKEVKKINSGEIIRLMRGFKYFRYVYVGGIKARQT